MDVDISQLYEDFRMALVNGVEISEIVLQFAVGIASEIELPDTLVVTQERNTGAARCRRGSKAAQARVSPPP